MLHRKTLECQKEREIPENQPEKRLILKEQ